MDRQVYEQKINDQRFLIETLRAVNTTLKAKIEQQQKAITLLGTALENITTLEKTCCHRCEGNGRLYADGKAHLLSEGANTILCGYCGGSGYLLPEDVQEIASEAITKAEELL